MRKRRSVPNVTDSIGILEAALEGMARRRGRPEASIRRAIAELKRALSRERRGHAKKRRR